VTEILKEFIWLFWVNQFVGAINCVHLILTDLKEPSHKLISAVIIELIYLLNNIAAISAVSRQDKTLNGQLFSFLIKSLLKI